MLQRFDAREEWLLLRWERNGTPSVMSCFIFVNETGARCGSGRIESPGDLDLTVASEIEATTGFRGEYHLVSHPINLAPEGRPASVSLGEVVNEDIDPAGDADMYLLAYSAGDIIELDATAEAVTRRTASGSCSRTPAATSCRAMPTCSRSPAGGSLPSSGTYRMVIGGISGGTEATETGPYTFTLSRVSSEAEVVTAPIAIGDSVTAESIGQVGDVDDLVVAGPPGTEVQVFVRGSVELTVDAIVAGSSTPVKAGHNFATGRVTLPGSGRLGLRVSEVRNFPGALREHGLNYAGPYAIAVHQVDRDPETVGASLTLGTLVDAEALEFEGDVDEFTFAGTAGQSLTARISGSAGSFPVYGSRRSTPPMTMSWGVPSCSTRARCERSVHAPRNCTYLVRLQGVEDTRGRGAYRFRIN